MRTLATTLLLTATLPIPGAGQAPGPREGDFVTRNFTFSTGETLSELRLHYTMLGKPVKDGAGVTRNAVLIMHGTTGSGRGFLSANFAGQLFGAGQLLDTTKYFVILPDGIGHGKSSKPSDGPHMKFPRYTYDDMVKAQYLLVTEGLGVNHLRLVMGTSMGAMHTWVWGYTHPDFMDALMPLASNPVEIAGRNRMMRQMIVDDIENDPEWKAGEYTSQPVHGLTAAIHMLMIQTSVPLQWQKDYPTREAAEGSLLYAINSADDQVNPPELGILEREIVKVPKGRFILLPITDETRGYGTHSLPAIWGKYLAQLLASSGG